MRLMLVEDDVLLGQGLVTAFGREGYAVDWYQRISEAQSAMAAGQPDMVVLDWQLPDGSGIELLKSWRRQGMSLPVLMLTARDAIDDRIQGLDSGADDYLVKPFESRELLARLRALSRRPVNQVDPVLANGTLSLDPASHQVMLASEQVALSRREFALLHELIRQPDRVLTREQLIERLYSWGEELESNTLEVHVHHLRKKLGSEFIKTIRGVGYVMPKLS
ncbi:response regulator [Gallaecimonas pentaromativorans]|uniref:Two-component system response regulator QseB/two-component system response regulator BasR n=1 Tax=Gallaecimonas pentaromativorans TaxID=584787 RepID=A0A3N1PNW8_9GAMM|nr:response regulator [Gallaecimonas pentaromativorans]MED5524678.1 response regulator [Pseudomonadota bacterium]ROQ28667.1 two-component system response regulator QseB/two-component system response regulator BasR [Gallaecimonas pentaromativorans]